MDLLASGCCFLLLIIILFSTNASSSMYYDDNGQAQKALANGNGNVWCYIDFNAEETEIRMIIYVDFKENGETRMRILPKEMWTLWSKDCHRIRKLETIAPDGNNARRHLVYNYYYYLQSYTETFNQNFADFNFLGNKADENEFNESQAVVGKFPNEEKCTAKLMSDQQGGELDNKKTEQHFFEASMPIFSCPAEHCKQQQTLQLYMASRSAKDDLVPVLYELGESWWQQTVQSALAVEQKAPPHTRIQLGLVSLRRKEITGDLKLEHRLFQRFMAHKCVYERDFIPMGIVPPMKTRMTVMKEGLKKLANNPVVKGGLLVGTGFLLGRALAAGKN